MKIDKSDKWRVLLTEVLPYETPMIFSNEGFYNIVSKNKHEDIFEKLPKYKRDTTIPFEYKIKKNNGTDTRVLSVIHPKHQLEIVEFYEKYNTLILHLCSKSPFSLRALSRVAKSYYTPKLIFDEEPHKNAELEVEPEILNIESSFMKSYFTYKPVDLIYKFYDGKDYRRLEQRFFHLMQFDINKCFYNIYTHSIAWAIKSKEFAKETIGKTSFENKFDCIMQNSNYGETNGIVVGPEISRIFAEIILQQVDIDALTILDEHFKYGVDYELRRYIDDYFVFSNDPNILIKVKNVFEQELEKYKLYLNSAKEEIKSSPFTSDITVGKREVFEKVSSLFNSIKSEKENITEGNDSDTVQTLSEIKRPYALSKKFIEEYQNIVRRYNLSYEILGRDVIRIIKRNFSNMLRTDILNSNDSIENFFVMIYDILFYVYSMSMNSSTTFKLSQIIVLTCKFMESQDPIVKHIVYTSIFKHTEFVLTNNLRKTKSEDSDIESLNLIIATKMLGEEYKLSVDKLSGLFNIKFEENKYIIKGLNYFHIITFLFYIDDNLQYIRLKNDIEKYVVNMYCINKNPLSRSELVMLFFDYICCPFVSIESKRRILAYSGYCTARLLNSEKDKLIEEINKAGKWFVDWDENINLERKLKNKEWGATY